MSTDFITDNEYEVQQSILRGSWSGEKPIPYRHLMATRFLKFPFKFNIKEVVRSTRRDKL